MENLPAIPALFQTLLQQEKLEPQHLKILDKDMHNDFIDFLYDQLMNLKGAAQDAFYEKTCRVLNKQVVYEYHHAVILRTIDNIIRETGRIPPVANIVAITGYSRTTVQKHLKGAHASETRAEKMQAVGMMTENLLGVLLKAAMKGDTKAAKLYLDNMHRFVPAATHVSNQNNYIQVNNTVINQQVIQQLNPEQLKLIEQIVSGSNEAKSE
jgi:hypothetical protein